MGGLLLATLLTFVLSFSSCHCVGGTEAPFGADGALVLSSSNGSIEGFDSAPASTHLQFGAHDHQAKQASGTAVESLLPKSDDEELEEENEAESASEQVEPFSSLATKATTRTNATAGEGNSAPKFAPLEAATADPLNQPSFNESNDVIERAEQTVHVSAQPRPSNENTLSGHSTVPASVSTDLEPPKQATDYPMVPLSVHGGISNSVLTTLSVNFGITPVTGSTESTALQSDDRSSSSISSDTTVSSTLPQSNFTTEAPAVSDAASLLAPTRHPSIVLAGRNETAQQTTTALQDLLLHVSSPARVPSTAEPSSSTAKPNADAYVRPITQHSTDQFLPDHRRGVVEADDHDDGFERMKRGRCGTCQRKLHHCVEKCFQHHSCEARPELSCPRIDVPCFPPFKYEADQCIRAADCGDANHLCCLVGCSRKCVVGVPAGHWAPRL